MTDEIVNDVLAFEKFEPNLSEEYKKKYNKLINKLSRVLSMNKDIVLKKELNSLDENDDDLELLMYKAVLHVLLDLSSQGWVFDIKDKTLFLRMDNDNVVDKDVMRYRLNLETRTQFKDPHVKAFINNMEKTKVFNGEEISIKQLIGDPALLKQRIVNKERVCSPYIQLVTKKKDPYTGYYLGDIWRYFRYTWSIPYRTMPGRNLFYLVRDQLQPYHPIIGIFALGNSVLNLTVRDDDIGWTVNAIKKELERKCETNICSQELSQSNGKTVKAKIKRNEETVDEHEKRINDFANTVYPRLIKNIDDSINELYVKDLGYHKQTKYPKKEYIDQLRLIADEYSAKSIDNKNNENNPDWEEEAKTNLFKRKRTQELARLLSTKIKFNEAKGDTNLEKLSYLMSNDSGRTAINTALIANRKRKIGSNMMEIIVCGSIPPYNDLLGGKLISLLACSPVVIRDYYLQYKNQVSEIASRMKGEKVIRDSRLVFLGTTSLYSIGSSQYNRIKVPLSYGNSIVFKKMGITEGFGTVFFSPITTSVFSRILTLIDGGKRINGVFGEGTSPKFRIISRGLSTIGIRSESFLRHYSPRIVYSIYLAKNAKEFLLGNDDDVEFGFDIDNEDDVLDKTNEIIEYWYDRWLLKRLKTVNIIERLNDFDISKLLLSNR